MVTAFGNNIYREIMSTHIDFYTHKQYSTHFSLTYCFHLIINSTKIRSTHLRVSVIMIIMLKCLKTTFKNIIKAWKFCYFISIIKNLTTFKIPAHHKFRFGCNTSSKQFYINISNIQVMAWAELVWLFQYHGVYLFRLVKHQLISN